MSDVREAARAWLAQDPDPETREELTGILTAADAGDASALAELQDRFGTRLAFGTAGLRGELGAGSNRMNRVLVAQAAAGLAAYLTATATDGRTPRVVVGYDVSHRHNVPLLLIHLIQLFTHRLLLPNPTGHHRQHHRS